MPVFESGLDDDDVTGIEDLLVPVAVHYDAASTQTEEKLTVVVRVPMGARTLLERDAVEPNRLAIVTAQQAGRRSMRSIVSVGTSWRELNRT